MAAFTSFNAYPVSSGNALYTQWTFDSSWVLLNGANVNALYMLITDFSASTVNNGISSPVVIPLRDISNNLTTTFRIDNSVSGLNFPIVNGNQYQLMVQAVWTSGNTISSENSQQVVQRVSTIPQTPNFSVVPVTGSFQIQLLDSNNNVPTPISAFDGYNTLRGIFVTYSSPTQLYSQFIANDASNSLYNTPQTINVSLNTYEVAISSYNYDASAGYSWGGRSSISATQVVVVDDTPGPVTSLQAYEAMRDVSANLQSSYTTVQNKLTWVLPVIGASNESITSFNVYRNNVLIANLVNNPLTPTLSYIDNSSSLQVAQSYTYQVGAINSYGEGTLSTSNALVGVVFPTQTAFVADASGSNALALQVTNVANGFPLNSYTFDFSYNSVQSGSMTTGFQSTNPYRLDASNNVLYTLQSRTQVPSLTDGSIYYTTSYWTPVVEATPYNPVLGNATDVSLNPLNAQRQPSGNVIVSWNNPSTAIGITGQLSYTLSVKPSGQPDASYVLLNQANVLSLSRTNYTATGLNLGTAYVFKIVNILTGTGSDTGKVAVSSGNVTSSVVPFLAPGAVQNLALTSPSTNDMSYNFSAPVSSGGYALAGYQTTVYLLNDGSSVIINTGTLSPVTDASGVLNSLMGSNSINQGSQYELLVRAFVNGNTDVSGATAAFYGPSSEAINFTVPQGINSPSVSNANGTSILNGIQISWGSAGQYLALDGSNVVFNIYKNGFSQIASGVNATSYLDTAALPGVSNTYQVVPVVNGVSAAFIGGSTPTPSSSIIRLALPNQPTNLAVSSRSSNSVNFSWTAPSLPYVGASLNYQYILTDASGNVDASGTTTSTSVSVTGLDSAGVYTIEVYAGIQANSTTYWNTTNIPQIVAALYDSPPQAALKAIYGSENVVASSGALLVNNVDASAVTGLTFSNYRLQVATDASFLNIVSNTTSSNSEFYISGLNNGTLYYLRAINNYLDNNGQNVPSQTSITYQGTPATAPNQPANISAVANQTNSLLVSWDKPISGNIPSVYAINYGTDPNNLIDDPSFIPINQLLQTSTQFQYQINSLTNGQVYYINVIAGLVSGASIAVSQPSETITGVPYNAPSDVQNLQGIPTETAIQMNWQQPSQTGGAGVGLNGPLLYRLQLSTDASFNPIRIVQDVSGISALQYTFTGLIPNTNYYARAKAYFAVQGNYNNLAESASWVYSGLIITQAAPSQPTVESTADNQLGLNQTQRGRTVLVNYNIDPTKACYVQLRRQILTPDGSQILAPYAIVGNQTHSANNSGLGQFIDTSANNPNNFLNGNQMMYMLDVSYQIAGSADQFFSVGTITPAVPYDQPFPTDISGNFIDLSNVIVPLDMSGGLYSQFKVKVNKNGSDLNNIVAVGLTAGESNAYVISQVSPSIQYNNVQVNGQIAQNQYGEITLQYLNGSTPVLVANTLAILTNRGGSLLARQPNNGAFGPNP